MEKLIKRIDAFCRKNGVTPRQFGRAVANTEHLYGRIKAGKVQLATIVKVESYLDAADAMKVKKCRK